MYTVIFYLLRCIMGLLYARYFYTRLKYSRNRILCCMVLSNSKQLLSENNLISRKSKFPFARNVIWIVFISDNYKNSVLVPNCLYNHIMKSKPVILFSFILLLKVLAFAIIFIQICLLCLMYRTTVVFKESLHYLKFKVDKFLLFLNIYNLYFKCSHLLIIYLKCKLNKIRDCISYCCILKNLLDVVHFNKWMLKVVLQYNINVNIISVYVKCMHVFMVCSSIYLMCCCINVEAIIIKSHIRN